MFESHIVAAGLLLASALVPGSVLAAPDPVEFSADIHQTGPNGVASVGRINVASTGVRTELTQNGQQVIQIFDAKSQTSRMILPAQKTYMEQRGPGAAQMMPGQQSGEANPCGGLPGASCRNLGTEEIAGRSAVKWEMTLERQGQVMRSTQWIDRERGFPLRQEMPNNQRMEQKMVGTEDLAGRKVEKWEVRMVQGNQAPQTLFRWFDPQLNMVVREEFPGGYVREMRNIRVGAQDPSLFQVPAGFKLITPQQPGQQNLRQ